MNPLDLEYEKYFYCQQLLKRKRVIKRWEPKLTLEEKNLFDNEELLSSYQNIIANTCGAHQQIKNSQQRTSIEQSLLPIHRFCRKGFYPNTLIQRQQIDDHHVPWTVDLPNYNPPYYTHPSVLNNTDDIDPEIISSNFMWNTFDRNFNVDRRTANPTGFYPIDDNGYPLNPLGRTGLCGRGELKRWGVNYQTHLVIMCGTNEIKSGKEIFKYLMEKPIDSHHFYYRLPSTWTTGTTMESIKKTLQTYLFDIYQSWNNFHYHNPTKINQLIEHLTFVSTAYIGKSFSFRLINPSNFKIDDVKNTDNAWLETSVCCYVQTNSTNQDIDLNELFPDSSLSNKTTFTWHHITRTSHLLDSERDVIKLIAKRYNAYW